MTNFIRVKTRLIPLLIVLTGSVNPVAAGRIPENNLILLDLSDRLLQPDQSTRDTAIIMRTYQYFLSRIKTGLIINSRDRFSIVLAPQQGRSARVLQIQERLTLDLGIVPPAQRLRCLQNFTASLPILLSKLYKEASAGKRHEQYPGCDIWRYFNEELPLVLKPSFHNKLLILTDGYFDFENMHDKLQQQNRYTTTAFLKKLPANNWKEFATKTGTGILPTSHTFPALSVWVVGLNPKCERQDETVRLDYFWREWLTAMKVKRIAIFPNTVNQSIVLASINSR